MILNMEWGTILPFILLDLATAYAAGKIAQGKGYSYHTYCVIALLLPVVGLVIALALQDKAEQHQPSEPDKASALREYKRLLDDGTITQQEFDAKKRELLS
jgi:hypothetical protein